jgi:hypothetical protein
MIELSRFMYVQSRKNGETNNLYYWIEWISNDLIQKPFHKEIVSNYLQRNRHGPVNNEHNRKLLIDAFGMTLWEKKYCHRKDEVKL